MELITFPLIPIMHFSNICVCSFEKAALEYQDQLSAVTGSDCSIRSSEGGLLKLSSSPKHAADGELPSASS